MLKETYIMKLTILTSFENHMLQPQDDVDILSLLRKSTLLSLCHKKQGKLRQPKAHKVAPVMMGNCNPSAISQSILRLFHQQILWIQRIIPM